MLSKSRRISNEKVYESLKMAQDFADEHSGCNKVKVGSVFIPYGKKICVYGANETLPGNCVADGCHRIKLYGEDSKNHRLPSDCRALHSEVNVIAQAARLGIATKDGSIIVTRYPCEACARAIVAAGISDVYYGREQKISKETEMIFSENHVNVHHMKGWTYEDTER